MASKKILSKQLHVTMPDGSVWAVPVKIIAENRAKYYAKHDGISFEESLKDTEECFEEDNYQIEDWAANNMDWKDVRDFAKQIDRAERVDFQEGWVNGHKAVV